MEDGYSDAVLATSRVGRQSMNILTSNFTVAELCRQFGAKDLSVNKTYQRSEKVWPEAARSFLIETVFLGFPIPKIILWEKTDTATLVTHREVVDGQQRTQALFDFYSGGLRLSPKLETEEIAGRVFAEIPKALQQRFVTYSLGCDVLVGATEEEVREIFRRMNSYTVPLNPEEHRHATYQGEFKWFIYEYSKAIGPFLESRGALKENDFVRMRDAKLLTELVHALEYGIQTTSKGKLDQIYKVNDKGFSDEGRVRDELHAGFEFLESIESLVGSVLAKPYNLYSLALASIALLKENQNLRASLDFAPRRIAGAKRIEEHLGVLGECLEGDEPAQNDPMRSFWLAGKSRTNVKGQREVRFNWFAKALTGTL